MKRRAVRAEELRSVKHRIVEILREVEGGHNRAGEDVRKQGTTE